jgi:NAD(P)-dependent dehydrogenase (short-subunit alcohol dehydrogenase family)
VTVDLHGSVFIITGSGTGVGAECAFMLARSGARVVVNYSRSEKEACETEERCRALGGETLLVKADVSVDAECRSLVEQTVDRWGSVQGLVNNAAVTRMADPFDLEALSGEDLQQVYAVNVVGAYQMTRAVVPAMRRQGTGAIVNVSSNVALTGGGSSLAYTASKGALNALTLALARVLAPEIRVNAVLPGVINTRWMRSALGEERFRGLEQRIRETAAMRRIAEPRDVAEAIIWLLAGTEFVTGELLPVDGGVRLTGGQRPKRP